MTTGENSQILPQIPRLSDATLRDSAHMAGVEFNPRHARKISQLLTSVGVELVEVGMISGSNSADSRLIREVHDAIGPERAMSLVMVRTKRQVEEALKEAKRLDVQTVMFSIPTSEEHAALKLASGSAAFVMNLARHAIQTAKGHGMTVVFSGEDGARTEDQRLRDYVASGFDAGGDRFRLAETVATLTPWQMEQKVRPLVDMDKGEVEIHSHNMLGMAVANSIAACRAGAQWVSATVGGIGERGGNAPLAEVLATLSITYGIRRYDLTPLTDLTRIALAGSGLGNQFQSGPTTDHAFAYELPGQLTHPTAYETLGPETVGNHRSLRVRTRITPALVQVALDRADTTLDIDLSEFTAWLVEHQETNGRNEIDEHQIAELARTYLTHTTLQEATHV
ncbi:isopropylmalate synthase [Brevibacterium sp. XM4083]|uniref:isopropylmalate synthase n=1 Tax=Brevibacterium sp. XM4083 TaxID=2583238 RepID=UPI00112A22EB|nr:isopropylmalate synthase [Brevibacterium sp. XM4083]MCM1011810.1 hypothetical protein [Brevibacterium sp. XM4083]